MAGALGVGCAYREREPPRVAPKLGHWGLRYPQGHVSVPDTRPRRWRTTLWASRWADAFGPFHHALETRDARPFACASVPASFRATRI